MTMMPTTWQDWFWLLLLIASSGLFSFKGRRARDRRIRAEEQLRLLRAARDAPREVRDFVWDYTRETEIDAVANTDSK